MMNRTKNRGFTLIEIAIVLVIIGLLLGGVLKGQELINNARVKSFANDFRNIPISIYAYQDRFRAIPGDDSGRPTSTSLAASTRRRRPPRSATARSTARGTRPTNTDESCLFWSAHPARQSRRLALPRPPAMRWVTTPTNASGGQIGVQSSNGFATITLPTAMTGTYIICSTNISGQFVLQLDTLLDDGNSHDRLPCARSTCLR